MLSVTQSKVGCYDNYAIFNQQSLYRLPKPLFIHITSSYYPWILVNKFLDSLELILYRFVI